jgi:hypothetical protein
MKEDEQNMDELIRNKLENYIIEPPEFIWENIQAGLVSSGRKKRIAYYRWIAAAAILIFALITGWYIQSLKTGIEVEVAEETKIETSSEEIKNNKENDPKIIQKEKNSSSNQLSQKEIRFSATKIINSKGYEQENELIAENRTDNQALKQVSAKKAILEIKNSGIEKLRPSKANSQFVNENDIALIAGNIERMQKSNMEKKAVKVGMHVSPGYASHTAAYSENYKQTLQSVKAGGNRNVGGGISFQYRLLKKLGIESGVYYAQNGQKSNQTRVNKLFANYDMSPVSTQEKSFNSNVNLSNDNLVLNSTAGKIEMSSPPKGSELRADFDNSLAATVKNISFNGEVTQVFNFMEIPLYIRYSLLDSKFGIQVSGGINAGIVVGNKAYISSEGSTQQVGKTQDISALNISTGAGVGFSYAISRNFSLSVEPKINYYLNSINRNGEIEFKPYRIGIFSGLNYEF